MAVLRHWYFQQMFVALSNSFIQLSSTLLGAWERFPYRAVLVLTVCFFHDPHFFRHFGRDLGKVFWASYMHEAVWEVPLVCAAHV